KTTVPYLDYIVDRAMAQHDVARPSGKAEALNEVLPHLAQIEDAVERDEYAKRAAERLKVEDGVLRAELRRAAKRRETKLRPDRAAAARALTELERRFLVVLFGDTGVRSSVLPTLEDEDIEGLAS